MAEPSSREELANTIGVILAASLLSSGLLSIVAIGSGHAYSFLYNAYCTYSLNCFPEALASLFAYTSPLPLFFDVFMLYVLWRYATKLVPLKAAFLSLIAGGCASLYAEGLLRIYMGNPKAVVVGAGGIAALAAIAVNYPKELARPKWIRIGERVFRIEPRPWIISALYIPIRALMGLSRPLGAATTLALGITASYVVGAFIYLLLAKELGKRAQLSAAIALLTMLWITLAFYVISPSFAEMSGTSLAIYSTNCYICYSLYRGFLSGCDNFRFAQKLVILPFESLPSGSESLVPSSARGIWYSECVTSIDKMAAASPHALLINLLIVIAFNSIAAFVIYKAISSPRGVLARDSSFI